MSENRVAASYEPSLGWYVRWLTGYAAESPHERRIVSRWEQSGRQ